MIEEQRCDEFKFMEGEGDERSKLLASCVANQQRAGFKNVLDVREVFCPNCKASGFNTGWGFWAFACGAEILSDGDQSMACQVDDDNND